MSRNSFEGIADKNSKHYRIYIKTMYNGKEIPVYSFSINETSSDDIQTVTLTVPMRVEIKDTE
jgi:hypothetical protein